MKVAITISALISLPIWFYLMYKVLESVDASELMWFLFWIYLPAQIIVRVIGAVSEMREKQNKS